MKIEYVNNGIGNNFGEVIELNENLKKYPRLHDEILSHELKHHNLSFEKSDFIMDITEDKVDKKELIKFILKNPKSLTQFLPMYYTKKWGFVYDLNLSLFYAIVAFFAGLSIFIGLRYF